MPFSLLPSDTLLPLLEVQRIALPLGWTLVMAEVLVYLLRAFPPYLRIAGVVLTIAWNVLPTPLRPSEWLGLAFQSPSLSLQGACLLALVRAWRARQAPVVELIASEVRWPNRLLLLITLLGWVLVLDLLAVVNVSIYAVGFTAYGVFVALLLAAGLELMSLRSTAPGASRLRDAAALSVAAIAVHCLLRLPSGNVWDALIDPWLWLGAQAVLMFRAAMWIVRLARTARR